MRKILFSLAMLGLLSTACASKEKVELKEATPQPVAAEQAGQAKTDATKPEAKEAVKENVGSGNVECLLEKDKRVIEVVKTDGGGCEVNYTKFDQKEQIATGTYGMDHCQKIQDRVKGNLEAAGFKCS